MIIRSRKFLVAALVSGAIVTILLFFARFRLPDLSNAKPAWLIALMAAFVVQTAMRGNLLRAFAEPALRGPRWCWVQLAARHQAIFALLPMGVGDAGFPYFANRMVNMPTIPAVRLLLQLRIRDMFIVFSMAAIGLAVIHVSPQVGFLVATLVFPALWFADRLAVVAMKTAARIIPTQGLAALMHEIADIRPLTPADRAVYTLLSLGIWFCSVAAVVSAFNMVGVPMGLAQAVLFIAAVNIAGLMKVSIAGLGVAEAGATAALVATGKSLEHAASLALVVRPAMLLAMLSACAVIDLAFSFWSVRRRA